MSEPFIVEVWGEPAGIVLQEGNAFRFHGTARPFFALDGTPFSTLGHALLAAAELKRVDGNLLLDDLHPRPDGRLS